MNLEDLLREAAEEANALYLASLPDPGEEEIRVSARFKRRMKRLIRQQARRRKTPVLAWAGRSVAGFFLTLLVSGSLLLTFSPDARAAFLGWVRMVAPDYYYYFFEGEHEGPGEGVSYRPTWVPEGYREIDVVHTESIVDVIYENSEGQLLFFTYDTDPQSALLMIFDDESETLEELLVSVGDLPGTVYLDDDPTSNDILVRGQRI